MKLTILSISKTEKGEMQLPEQFEEPVLPNLIKRAVISILESHRQPHGSDPEAGKRSSAKVSRRRRDYRGAYGIGTSRVPRKVMSRRGRRMNWVGAFSPGTVGGRRAHPPKAETINEKKINKKERRKAIRSALSATMKKEIVKQRGHLLPESYPFAIEKKAEEISKTKELVAVLKKLGFEKELERVSEKKIRAGKGKMRGKKYLKTRGALIVVSADCPLLKAGKNLPGVDIEKVDKLNAEKLAPGCKPGRMAIFTEAAIERIKKDKLFA